MADMCSQCRLDTGGNHERTCPLHPDNQKDKTDQRVDAPLVGWTCPACGGGLSPFTDRCPCVPLPAPKISVSVSVGGFIGDEAQLASEIGRVIREEDLTCRGIELVVDPCGPSSVRLQKPEPPTGRVQAESERP